MHLTEPLTTLTDCALAAASLAFAISLRRSIGPRNRISAWLWCAAFVASGVAAAVGGTFHGFAGYLDAGTLRALWSLTMFAIGACGAFIVAAIHAADIKQKDGTLKWLAYGVGVTLVAAAVQQGPFLRGTTFNHNDAYHLIQIAGLYCFYRCARTVRDRQGIPPDRS